MDLNNYFSKKDIEVANKHIKKSYSISIITEMQIKAMSYHHIYIRMAITKKNNYWWGCEETKSLCTAAMETSMAVVQQIKNRNLIWSSKPTSGYIPKRIKSRISKRHLPTYLQQYYSEQPRSGSNPNVQCPLMDKWINKIEKLHTHTINQP